MIQTSQISHAEVHIQFHETKKEKKIDTFERFLSESTTKKWPPIAANRHRSMTHNDSSGTDGKMRAGSVSKWQSSIQTHTHTHTNTHTHTLTWHWTPLEFLFNLFYHSWCLKSISAFSLKVPKPINTNLQLCRLKHPDLCGLCPRSLPTQAVLFAHNKHWSETPISAISEGFMTKPQRRLSSDISLLSFQSVWAALPLLLQTHVLCGSAHVNPSASVWQERELQGVSALGSPAFPRPVAVRDN